MIFLCNHYIIKKVSFLRKLYHFLCDISNYPPHFSEWKYSENWPNYCCCPKIHPPVGPWPRKKMIFLRNHYIKQKVSLFLNFYHILCVISNYPPHFSEWKYIKNWPNYRCCPKIYTQVDFSEWKYMKKLTKLSLSSENIYSGGPMATKNNYLGAVAPHNQKREMGQGSTFSFIFTSSTFWITLSFFYTAYILKTDQIIAFVWKYALRWAHCHEKNYFFGIITL